VGGIAQRRRVQNGSAQVWISAVLAVGAEALSHPEAVSEFYSDLGSSRTADLSRTTTLSHCLAKQADPQGLLPRLIDVIVRKFEERALAAALF
jgi:hypothetical protein